MIRFRRALAAASASAVIAAALTASAGAAAADAADNWASYNRTLAGDRFSPLAELTPANVAQLKQICAYQLPEVGAFQSGPLAIDGTLYFTTDEGSYAVDAASCKLKWRRHRHSPTPSALAVNRGFAYLDGKLFRGTSDAHVLARLGSRARRASPGGLSADGADRCER